MSNFMDNYVRLMRDRRDGIESRSSILGIELFERRSSFMSSYVPKNILLVHTKFTSHFESRKMKTHVLTTATYTWL